MGSDGLGENRRDIHLILAATFFYMMSPMMVTPLIVGYAGSLGAGAMVMGIIGGLMNICSLFCRPFVGNLADKVSKYRLSTVGALVMGVSCAGYVLSTDSAMLVASRLLNGIGYALCSVCIATWMSNMLPRGRVGSGMSMYGAMNALAMAVSPFLGVVMYQTVGYRLAFCFAAGSVLVSMLIMQAVRDRGVPAPVQRKERMHVADVHVLPFTLIILLFAVPYCATQSFIVTYADAMGLHVTVSLFFPLYAVALLVLRLALRRCFDTKPFRTFMLFGSFGALMSMVCLWLMDSDAVMAAGAFFMACGYGIMYSVCQSEAVLVSGTGHRGLANSTFYIGIDGGLALGPIVGGLIYGTDPSMLYPVLMATVPLGLLVYCVYRLRTRGRRASGTGAEA